MKATIDIPDGLYRQVKARSALRGQTVREVAVSLFQRWIEEVAEIPADKPGEAEQQVPPPWFGAARTYARTADSHAMESVRQSIARGRVREADADTAEPAT